MRDLMRAVMRALRSTGHFVWERCRATGRLIARLIPGVTAPDPSPTIEDYVPDPAPVTEDPYSVVKRVVSAMAVGKAPSLDDIQALGADTLNWIRALEPRHRARVLCATPDQLREHMRGRRAINGLLAADRESVAAWLAAKAREADREELIEENDLEGTLAAAM